MTAFSIIKSDGESVITVLAPAGPLVARSDHPNYEAIVAGALADEDVTDLFDVANTLGERFQRLSDRVTAAHGRLFLDGDEVANALATQVLRFLNEDVEDWRPLIAFFEKVQANPSEHSREQLFEWLDRRDFTIKPNGDIVAYKGVQRSADKLVSVNRGPAVVDGVAVNGAVPNAVGSTVEIARSAVVDDSAVGCASGLHVGTYDYAKGWAKGALLRVAVNPRDVVSVPTDCNAAKVRVCRYVVDEVIDAPITTPLYASDEDE